MSITPIHLEIISLLNLIWMISFLNTLSRHYPPTNFRVINVRPCTIQLHALLETTPMNTCSTLFKKHWCLYVTLPVDLWWVGVHSASLEMLRSMEQESLNIEQFCQRKFNKIKTKYFGETGPWSWYYWKEGYGGISKVKEGKRNNKNSLVFGRK